MANATLETLRGGCPAPFFNELAFPKDGGHIEGRFCAPLGPLSCCLPCPMTDWAYPDNFDESTGAANWINVIGMICCAFLLISWIALPVEKTHRHYLSISLTCAVVLMNLGFIVPLAGKPPQCYNEITPNDMNSNSVCAVSGAFLLAGGWAGIMWIFLRALSLHLQICWQLVVGRNYMWFSQILGWGIPVVGLVVLLVFSGVSFRFGATCHINHENSLADFWIPLLVFAGLTVIIQFATFGYCIRVYLASLNDNSTTTEGSNMPSYSNSIRTMTPRQAYRRVRRVIQLQWRGIVIVLIIITDVIYFAVIFVFLDNTIEQIKDDPDRALPWSACLVASLGDKNKCLDKAKGLVVNLPTVTSVLILLAMNGIWLLLLLGRWSMVTGWVELFTTLGGNRNKKEFVSVDARVDLKQDPRSYEMLSRDSGKPEPVLTPISATMSPTSPRGGRRTPDYFGQTARYQPHQRSFSSPRPPQQQHWDTTPGYDQPYPQRPIPSAQSHGYGYEDMNPLGMNRIGADKDEEAQYPRQQYGTARSPEFSRDQVYI
ncbi:hypothetical protein F4779DRAFT_394474 [Xylariaceae sp. FL0662B]|nr:hypothetical protein F4779DRAFT_394474 [Xylariaceae sp. FL0662B]